MNKNIDLNSFRDWQLEFPNTRRVSIKIGPTYPSQVHPIEIWVADDAMDTGMFVEDVGEIDLAGKKRVAELKELERLREKYKGTEG